jgi:N-acetylglucosaminyldiphosphoundecaprenol N-acetyl-beta-D-mannosaminyltransferase
MRNPLPARIDADRDGADVGRRPVRPVDSGKRLVEGAGASRSLPDDLSREVYCVLGMPVDAIDMATALRRVAAAAARKAPYLISTSNLNFLVTSLADEEFRDSLLMSELCTADGMPIVWISRLLGAPIRERVAGSDMFDRLAASVADPPLDVFFFGGAQGAAAAACSALNESRRLACVGSMYPGYGSIDELSGERTIDTINASGAQFLVVALGAAKGQAWLKQNRHRIQIPVRAHLGATVNFQAGSVARAPLLVRQFALEWLWRIKEEPHLWKRYWVDAGVCLRLLLTRVLPLAARFFLHRISKRQASNLRIETTHEKHVVRLRLSGDATAAHVARATVHFRNAVNMCKQEMVIDLSRLDFIDSRFFGLLLMVRKQLGARGARMQLVGASRKVERLFCLNELSYLVSAEQGA